MNHDNKNKLNLFDYFGFPSRQERDDAIEICDINKLRLVFPKDNNMQFCDTFFEQYSVWSNHINNFSSHLWLHFLLMYYQYSQNPLDTLSVDKLNSSKGAHKVFFDTFAEDTTLYLISYFDKHLEMFSTLYNLKPVGKSGKRLSLQRKKIIKKMKKIEELEELANKYQCVEQSTAFCQIKKIRDNFVHNKSLSNFGMDVAEIALGVYASGNSRGISTEETYCSVCNLLRDYEQLCTQVNSFVSVKLNAVNE